MKTAMKTLLVLVVITTSCSQPTPDPHIAAVEVGLRPAVVFVGDQPWSLQERMEHYGVPAAGIAVIEDSQVAWFKTYGLADRETGEAAQSTTLFQAGSISKPVAAFAALQMVEAGELSLDGHVNEVLKTWSLPDNEFTQEIKVTLRHLLSHTGGLTVHGFLGYAPGLPVPTLIEVLDGTGPANSDPIRVDKTPGGDFRYSGGGYTALQQMMIDASGMGFPDLMNEVLIAPAGMKQSTYEQPLSAGRLQHAAAGVLPDGRSVPGKRHTYPEMAAAGLWTTAEDLALFAIEVQEALQGKSPLMSKEMAGTMVTPIDDGYALGLGIRNRGDATNFGHGGWDEGFSAELIASRDHGYGAVVMINSNHPDFIKEVIRGVAFEYGWHGYEVQQKLDIPPSILGQAQGRYRYNSDVAMTVFAEKDRLYMRYAGDEVKELFYTGDGRFMRRERETPITFSGGDDDRLINFVLDDGELQQHALMAADVRLPSEVLEDGSFDEALEAYRRALEADPEDGALSEGAINRRGLRLLQTNSDFAIALLRINTALNPDSANTWDSVGYAYRKTGDREKAVEYYQAALERDPDFASAKAAIEEMSRE